MERRLREPALYRRLLAFAASVYFVWWFGVEWLLPDSFNPFGSRLATVLILAAFLAWSYVSDWAYRRLHSLFIIGLWLITLHYYYLFYNNNGDLNWIIGCYITVTAVSFGFSTSRSLFLYSLFMLALSIAISITIPALHTSVFLPGLFTLMFQANIAVLARQRAETERLNAMTMAENVRLRDEFISIASHELKTPLSSLKLQSELIERQLKKEEFSEEKIEKAVQLFSRQLTRLDELVETMLDVSHVSIGQLTITPESIDLAEVAREAVSSYAPNLVRLNVSESVTIQGDPLRLRQVIENLIGNAIKYGHDKIVEVIVKKEHAHAVLSVKDRGMGIQPEFMDRIFDRFERGNSSSHISGLGLGLYITERIVAAHGGTIHVRSEPEKGSTFTVSIPLA